MEYRTLILRMELCSYIPFQSRYLDNFHKVALWVLAYALHTATLVLMLVVVVELVAVTVSLLYESLAVNVHNP